MVISPDFPLLAVALPTHFVLVTFFTMVTDVHEGALEPSSCAKNSVMSSFAFWQTISSKERLLLDESELNDEELEVSSNSADESLPKLRYG